MRRCFKGMVWLMVAFGVLLGRPLSATAEGVITICYYMGDVRNNYGGTGALYYCEVWTAKEFIGGYSFVEPY